ncbi:uncharacterized protein LY79DRAFT_560972 [Colletotrichum navitas]|uniref:Secreted protein n=1 Tax=Colletotrichum navitas TaxID=681940 RepID=A0AAD8PUR8_9PEZI|nr:uncharacterized protein LY79DRAFT_560972 [Colletotrichum navitas]KAK1580617.1 hypothetical protein LY79DRAFT_560972 [Colletotrichum navitas]
MCVLFLFLSLSLSLSLSLRVRLSPSLSIFLFFSVSPFLLADLGSASMPSPLSRVYDDDDADAAEAAESSPTYPNWRRCTTHGVLLGSDRQGLDAVRAEIRVLGDMCTIDGRSVLGHVSCSGHMRAVGGTGPCSLPPRLSLVLGAEIKYRERFVCFGVPGPVLLLLLHASQSQKESGPMELSWRGKPRRAACSLGPLGRQEGFWVSSIRS